MYWSHGPTVFNPPPAYPINDTMFIVTIIDTVNNQSATDTVWVIVHPVPTSDFTLTTDSICDYETIQILYTGNASPTALYS